MKFSFSTFEPKVSSLVTNRMRIFFNLILTLSLESPVCQVPEFANCFIPTAARGVRVVGSNLYCSSLDKEAYHAHPSRTWVRDVHLIGPWGMGQYFKYGNIWTRFMSCCFQHFLLNNPQVNAKELHWWYFKIGSGNGLAPTGSRPLPEPTDPHLCRHIASPDRCEIMYEL